MNVDLLSISSHKIHGPKGVGALYIRKGTRLVPLLHGGEQEAKRRASTENTPGIIGFGKAAELALQELTPEQERLTILRDRLTQQLLEQIEDTHLNGHPEMRLPNNINLSVNYVEGESMVLNLDLEGICVSTGSACSSSSLEPSHVLIALGLPPEQAHGSLRITLGRWTSKEDTNRVAEVFPRIVSRLRAMSPLLKNR